jgi:tetratricopeptide (TPR) repeat protein
MAAFASARLDKQPEGLQWHALRGQARQRQGRCAEAVGDLKRAFDGLAAQPGAKADAVFAAGLALGACEMALRDWPAAARTMTAIEALAPARWEPAYNLGVIQALQGDKDAARATQERLAALSPGAARSLQAYADACGGVEPLPRVEVDSTPPTRLTSGPRTVVLPPGRWVPIKSTPDTVSGSQRERGSFRDVAIPVSTQATHARAEDGRVLAAIAFTANATQAYGTSFWNVGDPCAASDTLHVERPNQRNDRPECLSLRSVDAALASLSPRLRPALQAALEGGASLPSAGYELHFARYEWDWVVDVTWLVPMCRLAGDLDAMAWLRTLAAQWPSMHPRSGPQVAAMPPLAPDPRGSARP